MSEDRSPHYPVTASPCSQCGNRYEYLETEVRKVQFLLTSTYFSCWWHLNIMKQACQWLAGNMAAPSLQKSSNTLPEVSESFHNQSIAQGMQRIHPVSCCKNITVFMLLFKLWTEKKTQPSIMSYNNWTQRKPRAKYCGQRNVRRLPRGAQHWAACVIHSCLLGLQDLVLNSVLSTTNVTNMTAVSVLPKLRVTPLMNCCEVFLAL